MRKKLILLMAAMVIIAVFLVSTYPNFIFLEPYAHSGGFAAFPQNKICDCAGISYSYELPCCDRGTEYYCMGILSNCRCLNSTQGWMNPVYIDCALIDVT